MSLQRSLAALLALAAVPIALTRCAGPAAPKTAVVEAPSATATAPIDTAPPAPIAAPAMSWTAGTIQCGSALCRAHAEVCCGDGRCAPYAAGKASDRSGAASACEAGGTKGTPQIDDRLKLCDDASDCDRGDVCCNEPWTADRAAARCVHGKQGKSACALDESCMSGAPCATPGTQCVRGTCRRVDVTIRCGVDKCRAGESCCGKLGSAKCMAVKECAALEGAVEEYACSSPSHCPHGMYCVARAIGSFCTGTWDASATTTVVCDSATDCPKTLCGTGKGAPSPRCAKADEHGLRLCRCPD